MVIEVINNIKLRLAGLAVTIASAVELIQQIDVEPIVTAIGGLIALLQGFKTKS